MTKKKITVLGVEYDYIEDTQENLGFKDANISGRQSGHDKTIEIVTNPYDGMDAHLVPDNQQSYIKQTKRHEIIHAFFDESAAHPMESEPIVEWFACMFPKMLTAFQEVDAL